MTKKNLKQGTGPKQACPVSFDNEGCVGWMMIEESVVSQLEEKMKEKFTDLNAEPFVLVMSFRIDSQKQTTKLSEVIIRSKNPKSRIVENESIKDRSSETLRKQTKTTTETQEG